MSVDRHCNFSGDRCQRNGRHELCSRTANQFCYNAIKGYNIFCAVCTEIRSGNGDGISDADDRWSKSSNQWKLLDGDHGPNTGGMGAFSPANNWSSKLQSQFEQEIMRPVLGGLLAEGITFRGLLYPGLMITRHRQFCHE